MNALDGIEARIGEDTARVLRSCVALLGSDAQSPGSADEICARIGAWAAQARECVCFGGRDHVTAERVIEVCAMALGAPISEVTRTGKGNRSSLCGSFGRGRWNNTNRRSRVQQYADGKDKKTD